MHNRKIFYGGLVGILTLLFSSCDTDQPPLTPTYNCVWVDSVKVAIADVKLNKPSEEDCEYLFREGCQYMEEPHIGIYHLFEEIESGECSCETEFSWVSSVYTKECERLQPSLISRTLYMDDNNYTSFLTYQDRILYAPIVRTGNGIDREDYKHQMVIKVHNVYNSYDNSTGTVSWVYTWLGMTESTFSNNTWCFYTPQDGLYGTFIPDYGFPRYIYYHDSFDLF